MKESSSNLKSMVITIIVMAVIGALLVAALPTPTLSAGPSNAPEVWVNAIWNGSDCDGYTWDVDAFATISEGVYNVASGGIVHVYPGIYNGGVTIDKPLVLNGANAGVPGDGTRGDESIINGSDTYGNAITVASSDVVVNGFEIASTAGATHGISAESVNNLAVNNTRILGASSEIIYLSGVTGATIVDNYIASEDDVPGVILASGDYITFNRNTIDVANVINDIINGEGDYATINSNEISLTGAVNGIVWYGDGGSITNNGIGTVLSSSGMEAMSVPPGGAFVYYSGDGAVIKNNVIGGENWSYWVGIAVNGTGAVIDDNDLTANIIFDRAIDLQSTSDMPVGEIIGNTITASWIANYSIACDGQSASIMGNTITARGLIDGIYCTGDDGTIDGNDLTLTDVRERFIDYYGDRGVINDNTIVGMNVSMPYCTGNDVISYIGMNGNITKNVIQVTGVGDNVIQYYDESMLLASAESQQFPNYAGTIADNTLSAAYVDYAFIEYIGDAGKIQRNADLSPNEYMWPMVIYGSVLFGHGVITDNVGGAILYMGEMIQLAPYGTISGNHINSSTIGIAAIGDYNVITGNEINAMVGMYTVGTNVLVESNDFTAIPYPLDVGGIEIPLSVGALFDGDQCSVTDNTFDNFALGVGNVGLFQVIGITAEGAVDAGYTDEVNGNLEDISAKLAAISDMAKGYVADHYASTGEGASAMDVTALSSLGYRGYGNTITGNAFNYDNALGIVGIVTLGYNFAVDSNTFSYVNDSYLLAGMIVGGDGGKVTNNDLSNVTLLGMYYGGLLKFEDGIYTSDLLGMDAQITGNTVDNRNGDPIMAGLFPWGIIFTGYDAAIEDNDLLGTGLGILTVQFEGSIVGNTIDTFSDESMTLLSVDGASVKPMEGEVVSGLGGIISVCNNLTVTNNLVNGTLMGMLFVPIDPYTTWGNAYIADNVLTNNVFQMAFVPSYFQFHMGDGSVKPIDTATMLEVMGDNTLDRAVYVTNATGDFCVLPLLDMGYFDVSAAGVYSDIYLGVIFAYLCDGSTVNVMPGTYTLNYPIPVPPIPELDGLTILGDAENPENVVVDTGKIPVLSNNTTAFEVYAPNVTISGFLIENSNNTFADKDYYQHNYGVAMGPLYGYSITTATPPSLFLVNHCNVTDNVFRNLTCGVYLDSCAYTTIERNLFTDNNMGVYLTEYCYANSTEIHYNDIAGNTEYGVNNNNGEDRFTIGGIVTLSNWVNATDNWWGSYLGPYHETLNPDGTGDNVTDYVLFEPWLTAPVFASQYEYHLVAGWNLIGVPLDVPDTSIGSYFPANVLDDIEVIWGWDEAAQNWVLYSPVPDEPFYDPPYNYPYLTSLETGRAYWVYLDEEAYFQVEGAVPDSAPKGAPLVTGWNFVSITGICQQDVAGMYPDAVVVWGWDEAAQNWVLYSSDPNEPFYDPPYNYPYLTEVLPGHGYWVYIEGV